MISELIAKGQNAAVRQLNSFLTANVDSPGTAWPRLSRSKPSEREVCNGRHLEQALHVLIVGDLTLELPVRAKATRAEVLASLRPENACPNSHWSMDRLRVGGFVGHAVEVASKLGATVSICTNVPVPTPQLVEEFFEEFAVDRRFVTGVPGSTSVSVVAHCTDGRAVFGRPGMATVMPVSIPKAATCGVNAILVDPCAFRGRTGIARSLSQCLKGSSPPVAVGLRADHRSRSAELTLAQDDHVWTFFRKHDGKRLVEQSSTVGHESELVQRLHDRFGIAKLVVQLGAKGAVMLNGTPGPYHVHTCPVSPTEFTAPGDTLLAVTTLASAAGADDKMSLRRGVAAATGEVAGLELPTSFHELDAA